MSVDTVDSNVDLQTFFREISKMLLANPKVACNLGRIDLLACNLAKEGGKDNCLILKLEVPHRPGSQY